jgi:hypothetical protein
MPVTRQRYQEGSIQKASRAKGPDVWVFRWRELTPDGRRVQRKKTIGTVKRFKTESEAKKAVEPLRAEVNAKQEVLGVMTFAELWGDFAKKELRNEAVDRSETTIQLYTQRSPLPASAVGDNTDQQDQDGCGRGVAPDPERERTEACRRNDRSPEEARSKYQSEIAEPDVRTL